MTDIIPTDFASLVVCDANNALREHYAHSNTLDAKRLSGDLLPMELCNISLTVLDPSEKSTSHRQDPFRIHTRWPAGGVDDDTRISVSSIFEARRRADGKVARPRRILIQGDAGVGKTTLCQRIVQDWVNGNLWPGMFDLVFWIPLRELRMKPGVLQCPMSQLFYYLYFWNTLDGMDFAKMCEIVVKEPSRSTRTLFILDGLDEVMQEGEDSEKASFRHLLPQLLSQPQVIITTRPENQGILLPRGSVDLTLEATGLLPEQIVTYIQNGHIIENPKVTQAIDTFLKQNRGVMEMMRIPLQLDALCYSWDPAVLQDQDDATTMTTIYDAVMWKLWKKDVVTLKKQSAGMTLNSFTARDLLMGGIQNLVLTEMNILEGLAFNALVNDIMELSSQDCQKIELGLMQQGIKCPDDMPGLLKQLSFSRTSDPSISGRFRSYHFVHSTFQEFFAARYFVKCCVQQQPLWYQVLRANNSVRRPKGVKITTITFFHREKYNARYDIFWQFVSGLLEIHAERMDDSSPLVDFLGELASQPQDLLVWTHQQLLVNCLSETWNSQQPGLAPLRSKLEQSLLDWASFLCGRTSHLDDFLAAEPADFFDSCSGHILCFLLHSDSEGTQVQALASLLSQRAVVSAKNLEYTVSLVQSKDSMDLKTNGLKLLLRHDQSPLQETMSCLKDCLSHNDIDVDSWGEELSRTFADALVGLLNDHNELIRKGSFHILRGSEYMTKDIFDSFRSAFDDEDPDDEYSDDDPDDDDSDSARSDGDLRQVVEILKQENSSAPESLVEYLVRKDDVPEELLPALSSLLQDRSAECRNRAFHCLIFQRQELSDSILEDLTTFVKDVEKSVWESISRELDEIEDEPLSPQILLAIALLLQDPSPETRSRAKSVLGAQPYIPEELFPFLESLLHHGDPAARLDAFDALRNAIDLPKDFTSEVALILEDADRRLRRAAFEVLSCQLQPSDHVLSRLILYVRWGGQYPQKIQGLAQQSDRQILEYAGSLLETKNNHLRDHFLDRLGYQLTGSEATFPTMIRLLNDASATNRDKALKAFFPTGRLRPEMLEVIFTKWARKEIERFISYLYSKPADWESPDKPLPEHVIRAMMPFLDHEGRVRNAIILLWIEQRHLPDEAVQKLLPLLEDNNDDLLLYNVETVMIRQAAFYALLPGLRLSALRNLYRIWFERSGKRHLQQRMYVVDGTLFVDVSEGLREVKFSDLQQERLFLDHIRTCQREMGLPLERHESIV